METVHVDDRGVPQHEVGGHCRSEFAYWVPRVTGHAVASARGDSRHIRARRSERRMFLDQSGPFVSSTSTCEELTALPRSHEAQSDPTLGLQLSFLPCRPHFGPRKSSRLVGLSAAPGHGPFSPRTGSIHAGDRVFTANGPGAFGVEEDQVRIAPDRDRTLARVETEDPRRVRGHLADKLGLIHAAAVDGSIIEDGQQRWTPGKPSGAWKMSSSPACFRGAGYGLWSEEMRSIVPSNTYDQIA